MVVMVALTVLVLAWMRAWATRIESSPLACRNWYLGEEDSSGKGGHGCGWWGEREVCPQLRRWTPAGAAKVTWCLSSTEDGTMPVEDTQPIAHGAMPTPPVCASVCASPDVVDGEVDVAVVRQRAGLVDEPAHDGEVAAAHGRPRGVRLGHALDLLQIQERGAGGMREGGRTRMNESCSSRWLP